MEASGRTDRRVRWYRVALLVALGASSGLAFTAPGRWLSWKLLEPVRPRLFTHFPLHLGYAAGKASRGVEVIRLCADLQIDGPENKPRVVPTPDEVARRLASLDGWSTAVMYELSVGVGGLYETGLVDIETCGRIVGAPWRKPAETSFDWPSHAIQSWRLVLLDEQRLCVGTGFVSAVRPGWAQSVPDSDAWMPNPAAPGDGVLPAVSVFRRLPNGEVVRG